MNKPALLDVAGLEVDLRTLDGDVRVVRGVDLSISAGERVALVGESGSGKTITSLALMGLLPSARARVRAVRIHLGERDLLNASEKVMRRVRGVEMGMVFQDPMTSLNPSLSIGEQLVETLAAHRLGRGGDLRARAVELLELVAIPDARRRLGAYPHELSGGMRQRVMLAMTLGLRPRLLIADEPSTALDVTIQAQILDLVRNLTSELGSALLLITHDLGVVAGVADRMYVMYAGRIVERGSVDRVFLEPRHPYTAALLRAMPRVDSDRHLPLAIPGAPPSPTSVHEGCPFAPRCDYADDVCWVKNPQLDPIDHDPGRAAACWFPERVTGSRATRPPESQEIESRPALITINDLRVHLIPSRGLFGRVRAAPVRAIDGVNLTINRGETLGLVGESGSGKTTLARAIIGLVEPTSGQIALDGQRLPARGRRTELYRRMQMIFQDPYSSLDPRMTIEEIIAEPLVIHRVGSRDARRRRISELIALVGIPEEALRRHPHEFSGGQRQRIGIARAIALEPELILADEPVSALDVSIQAQVLELLQRLQERLGLTYLFVAHDLAVIRSVSDRIAVMYLGRVVELAPSRDIYAAPAHPYTVALLSAAPVPDPAVERVRRRIILRGDLPSPSSPPPGCRFHTRCWLFERLGKPERCRSEEPVARDLHGHRVECHFAEETGKAVAAPVATIANDSSPAPRNLFGSEATS